MPDSSYLSTARVAKTLGVSVTTVKRWVDEGVLPAHKTAGGHRKILSADVLRLIRRGDFPHAELEALVLPDAATVEPEPSRLEQQLYEALAAAELSAVRAVIQGGHRRGLSLVTLADEIIAPAMRRLGHDWELGEIDVRHEHRGTQLCVAALYELKATIEVSARPDRPLALGGTPEGDFYTLANLLVEMVLLDQGWKTVNIGPNTPMSEFRKALAEWKPRLLWLSINHLADKGRFATEYRTLYEEAYTAGVAVALGGNGLGECLRASLPYTMFGDGLAHLADFARTLHVEPSRPKRGRPPSLPDI